MVHHRIGLLIGVSLSWSTAVSAQTEPSPEEPAPAVATRVGVAHSDVTYGAGARLRWVSVPHWLLDAFTKQNQSLSSYGFAAEGFRRKGDLDIMLSLSYQRMAPPDGNWLGKGHDANLDTDFIQFRNFGLVGIDAAFIWRNVISQYVAFRYGAGLGLAIVTGQMLRTSAAGCTEQNAGNTAACRPAFCPASGCTEAQLARSQGPIDNGPGDAHRFPDSNVPGAIPILNLTAGFDFHIPQAKGLELRVEGGFYDAFFLGVAGGYLFE
jgi:hypothetical protein